MASLVAGGIKSLEAHLEVEGANSDKIVQIFDLALPKMKKVPKPRNFFNDPSKMYEIGDLPLRSFDDIQGVRYAFDIVRDYTGPLDMNAIGEAKLKIAYQELPEPLRPQEKNWA